MPRRLPPLNALRAFEAAARHMSITRAAVELGVSKGAVSQQIRQLEDYFGAPLFIRLNQRIMLTAAGQACLPSVRNGFEQIEAAVRHVSQAEEPGTVGVNVETSFALKWMVPRLKGFSEAYPGVDLRFVARPVDPTNVSGTDNISIIYGIEAPSGLVVDHLLTETIVPVCSPELLKSCSSKGLDALATLPLLHDDTMKGIAAFPNWRSWLGAAGRQDVDALRGSRFTVSALAIEAAVEGSGVILGRSALIERELAEGRLVPVVECHFPTTFDYQIIAFPGVAGEPHVGLLIDWLIGEGEAASRFATTSLAQAS